MSLSHSMFNSVGVCACQAGLPPFECSQGLTRPCLEFEPSDVLEDRSTSVS